MTVHMLREFEKVKKDILWLSALVEESVGRAMRAVSERNPQLAQKVIEADRDIDLAELDVEEECLKTLALHQPVASDLRFIVAVLKMNSDLERMADLAGGISRNATQLARLTVPPPPFDLQTMSDTVRRMLKQTLDALVNLDAALAERVIAADREVDDMLARMYTQALECSYRTRDEIDSVHRHISIARCLERIADHATNVAEDVIYLVKGEIVRHGAAQHAVK
jgi:phosphate transport system protein